MLNKTGKLLFLVIASSIIFAFTNSVIKFPETKQSTQWKLEKDNNNIKVYTRQAEGSKIKEFKALTTVTTDVKLLESLIENVSDYPNWQTNITIAKTLKKVSATTQYIYYTTDIPWPLADRDAIVFSEKLTGANNSITYNLISKPDYIEVQEDFLRIKNAKGLWQFTPQTNNKIEVIYQFYGDPEGSLPGWLINMFIVDGPYTTMLNLKKKTEKQ
jgi:hypothetical protein